ncbi:MAG: sugar ABC transporter permease [Chloroflexi bacterium]|nr:sugar ABC transporter permease [Chloroflexota bacterium]
MIDKMIARATKQFNLHDPAVKKKWKRTLQAFLLVGPALVIALVFVYYPAAYILRLSFFEWDLISPQQTYVGLGNYETVLAHGSDFWKSLLITLKYGIMYIAFSLSIGMLLALALNRIKFMNNFFQSLFFVPSVTSISVVAVVWSLIFNPQIGPLNKILSSLGVSGTSLPQWFNDPNLALPALAVIGSWQSLGFITLLLLAGLRNIPTTYYEAAAVDGANKWKSFWKITLPLLSPVLFFVIFMLIINSFQVFGAVSIMTQGRPLGSTNVVLYYIYQQGFRFFNAGIASTASWIVFMVLLAIYMLQSKLGERNVFYQ